ncbi:MAG: CDP-alcohol phosphatidyltransferase family protein [Gemmatimonadota bacterium]
MNLLSAPNLISLLRIPLAAAFLLFEAMPTRLAVLALAAVSDFADGKIARARSQTSRLGELLDPVADKTFMLVAFVTLALQRDLPVWTIPAFLTRDIGVALGVGVLLLRGRAGRWPSRLPGKAVTWMQFGGVGVALVWPGGAPWFAIFVAAAGLVALRDYARSART